MFRFRPQLHPLEGRAVPASSVSCVVNSAIDGTESAYAVATDSFEGVWVGTSRAGEVVVAGAPAGINPAGGGAGVNPSGGGLGVNPSGGGAGINPSGGPAGVNPGR